MTDASEASSASPAIAKHPGEPLYRRVANDLIARIGSGEFTVDSVLPREVDLALALRVSRVTLRQALQILEKGGMVQRIRKVGTRVIARAPIANYVQRMDGVDSILRLAGQTAMRIDDVTVRYGTPDAGLDDFRAATGHWLCIEGVRRMRGQQKPSTWCTVYVDNKHAGIGPLLTGEVDSVFALIEQVYGLVIHAVRHRIAARALPAEAAAVLGLPAGAPVLEVQAWLFARDGSLIEYVRSMHDPAAISVELTSTRSD